MQNDLGQTRECLLTLERILMEEVMTDNPYPPTELEDAARCAYRRGLGAEVQYLGFRVGVAAPFSPGLGSTEALSRDEATDR